MSKLSRNIVEIINIYQNKVELKLVSKEYAKGYLYGMLDSTLQNNEEYDRISKVSFSQLKQGDWG